MRILQQRDPVLLIDLSNLVARAVSVASEYGFLELLCRMLQKLRKRYPSHKLVFATEGAGTLKRQEIVREYKGGRPPSPELYHARNTALELLQHLECCIIKASDGEADDAIGAYCRQHPNTDILILSDDRDLWQLITTSIQVVSRVKGSQIAVDRFACQRFLGVTPKLIPLVKAVLGDKSDCIPRAVERVHKAKLLRLVNESAGDLDQLQALVATADWLTPKEKIKLDVAMDTVKRQLQVTRIRDELPIKSKNYCYDVDTLASFLEKHGLTRELLW